MGKSWRLGLYSLLFVVVGATAGSADVLFLSEATDFSAHASAAAGGSAFGAGLEGSGNVASRSKTLSNGITVNDGAGQTATIGAGLATAGFNGSNRSVMSVTSDPVTTMRETTETVGGVTSTKTITTTTVITTRIVTEQFEVLTALASDVQGLTTVFESPSSSLFSFSGQMLAAYRSVGITRIASTPETTTTVVTATKVSQGAPTSPETTETKTTTTDGPTTVQTFRGLPSTEDHYVSGYAQAAAASDIASEYTFAIVDAVGGTVSIDYRTGAPHDAEVGYEIWLVDDTTGAQVGASEWIGSTADGTIVFSFASPGDYSLFISEYSSVSAPDNLTSSIDRYAAARSRGEFWMSIDTVSAVAAPELSTWMMMLTGFAQFGGVVCWRMRRRVSAHA